MAERISVTRVLLADHHSLFRAGVRRLLEDMGGLEVAAECSDGREAVELAARHLPHLVLMEIGMPRLNGVEATRQIVDANPRAHILILSAHTSEEHVLRALRAGASGYIHKGSMLNEFQLAVQTVARGETFLSPAISRQVVEVYLSESRAQESAQPQLTPRQREILQLIAEGHSNKQIASILSASLKTVDSHRTNIMERLGIHNVSGLVHYAFRHGLIFDQ